MRLVSVLLARSLAFVEISELNPFGKVYLPDLITKLVQQYGFHIYPIKPEELDLNKGIEFHLGRSGNRVIERLVIYSAATMVETHSSTDESKEILLDIFNWAKDAFGITYEKGAIKRWAYISNILFYTDFPLLASFSPPLETLASKTTKVVSEIFHEELKYESLAINIGHDPTKRKNGIAGLIIQHRADAPFSDNKYYSEAPLPTNLHIKFLEEFEADVVALLKSK